MRRGQYQRDQSYLQDAQPHACHTQMEEGGRQSVGIGTQAACVRGLALPLTSDVLLGASHSPLPGLPFFIWKLERT